MPGLAVLIEKKSRRMELALYCLSRAIESFLSVNFTALRASPSSSFPLNAASPTPAMPAGRLAGAQSHAGFFDAFRRSSTATQAALDVIILALAAGIIMHCYANEREVFRSKYLNVLDWVFGVPRGCESGDGGEATQGEEKRGPGPVRNATAGLASSQGKRDSPADTGSGDERIPERRKAHVAVQSSN